MLRKTVLIAGENIIIPAGLKEILEQKFGCNRYLILFASDKAMAQSILAQTSVSIVIDDQNIEQMIN